MKYAFLVLAFTFILMSAGNIQSQQSDVDSIYITCSGDPELPYVASPPKIEAPMSDYSDIDLRGYCIVDVMDAVKSNLRHEGIALVVGTKPSSHPATANIYFGLDAQGTPVVSLRDLTPIYLLDSSLLSAHLTDSIDAYAWNAIARQDAANLITGVLLYSVGQCEAALSYFDVVEKRVGNNSSFSENSEFYPWDFDAIKFYRANCASLDHDYQKALGLYETFSVRALSLEWNNAAGNLAWLYFQLGEQQKAFVLITKLIELSQNNPYPDSRRTANALVKRSQLYALAFSYTDAIADMDSAIALDPANPALYVERGQRIILTYNWDRALADYNHALQLDPNDADAYYYRGILYSSVPEGIDARRSALADFQRYLDLAPDGQHAADAAHYVADIQDQLDALGATP